MGKRYWQSVFSLLVCIALALPLAPPRSAQAAQPTQPFFTTIQVESSRSFTAALRDDGTVWTWGRNEYNQLGTNGPSTELPQLVIGPHLAQFEEVVEIAIGKYFGAALDKQGDIWVWGTIHPGDPNLILNAPTRITSGGQFKSIAAGDSFGIALSKDSQVFTFGVSAYLAQGQNSDSSTTPGEALMLDAESNPVPLEGVEQIAAGGQFGLALYKDGTVYAWGPDHDEAYAVPVTGLTGVDLIFAGGGVGFATVSEAVYGWGSGSGLGFETSETVKAPTLIPELSAMGIQKISASPTHTLVLTTDGNVYGAGSNVESQIRTRDMQKHNMPFGLIPEMAGAEDIFAGHERTFVLRKGTMWVMGNDRFDGSFQYGALGVGHDLTYYGEHDTYQSGPLPMMDLIEGYSYEPKAPLAVQLHQNSVNTFRIDYDLAPFSTGNKLIVDIHHHPAGTKYRSDIFPLSSHKPRNSVTIAPLEPGVYSFDIYTCDCNGFADSHSDDTITLNNNNQGYVVEDTAFAFSFQLLPPEGEQADGFTVVLNRLDGPFSMETVITGEDGIAAFPNLVPARYHLYVQKDGTKYHDGSYYLIHDNGGSPFQLQLTDPRYRIDELFIYQEYDEFNDKRTDVLYWRKFDKEDSILAYHLYWFDANGKILESEPPMIVPANAGQNYQMAIDTEQVPEEAIGLAIFHLVKDGNDERLVDAGARMTIRDVLMTTSLMGTVTDANPAPHIAKRTVTWKGLKDERSISHYVLRINHFGWNDIAEIPAEGKDTYSFEFPVEEYDSDPWRGANLLDGQLLISVKYRWGEESQINQVILPVDNTRDKTSWAGEIITPNLTPPICASLIDVDPAPDRIEGWIRLITGNSFTGMYEVAFLDENLSPIRSIMQVVDEYRFIHDMTVNIPQGTEVPANAAYIGIFTKDRDEFRFIYRSHEPFVIPLGDQGGGGCLPPVGEPPDDEEDGDPPGEEPPGEEPPADEQPIADTKYGILDGDNRKITHIPQSVSLRTLMEHLEWSDGAAASFFMIDGETVSPEIDGPIVDGMELYVEGVSGSITVYTLWTLSGLLDGQHNGDGKVDLTDILRFLTSPRDVDGDGLFTVNDIQLLLEEIDPVVFP